MTSFLPKHRISFFPRIAVAVESDHLMSSKAVAMSSKAVRLQARVA
jgi:hypothetical protein